MITEEMKKEIISSWQKGDGVSQISRDKNVSRPTVRKILREYKETRNWWLIRTFREDGFLRLLVNTTHTSANKKGSATERLALGVEHWEVNGLIRSIVKPDTADEIMSNFMRDPPRISIVYIKESEFLDIRQIRGFLF
ncbi:helix-turn-helix domain-containing protein [Candidatus Bathyarchaeota archaeon]|nr:helix-turn-helix domain-containing protein [Candidatus Bathyarchaeota archaeon]